MPYESNDDILINWGSEIKVIDRINNLPVYGGWAIVFGDESEPDLSELKDYFTKDTYFELDINDKMPVLFNHGFDPQLKGRVLGVAEAKVKDDFGVWVEFQLKQRDDYEKFVAKQIEAKKQGLSTGTARHRMVRERQDNGTHKILEWPLGIDLSITPTPADYRTSIASLKSLQADTNENAVMRSFSEIQASMDDAWKLFEHRCESRKLRNRPISHVDLKAIGDFQSYLQTYTQRFAVSEDGMRRPSLSESDKRVIEGLRSDFQKLRTMKDVTPCLNPEQQERAT